jgi:hypothetical protein
MNIQVNSIVNVRNSQTLYKVLELSNTHATLIPVYPLLPNDTKKEFHRYEPLSTITPADRKFMDFLIKKMTLQIKILTNAPN